MPKIPFKIVDLDIATGGPLVVVLNKKDGQSLDLHVGDRVIIEHKNKKVHASVDFTQNHSDLIKLGQIGAMEEILKQLEIRHGSYVYISSSQKPQSIQYIKKKLDGKRLNFEEIKSIVSDIVSDELSTIELTSFVTANYIHGLSDAEIVHLTKAMVITGDKLTFKHKVVMDLHSIGGVPGDRTTMIAVPIAIAAGLIVPKTSSRAITSPSGTSDTMEVLANVSIPINRLKVIVKKVGGCMVWGGALNLAPADDKIIRVEHPLSIDAEGQLIASVMAKKYSVGSTHLLLDIPIGPKAKLQTVSQAISLQQKFQKIGRYLNVKVLTAITDGSEPVSRGIGPALEALDVLRVLKNEPTAPQHLRDKSIGMAAKMLEIAGAVKKGHGLRHATEILNSGEALKIMNKIIRAQGKAPSKNLKLGEYRFEFKGNHSGIVKAIDSRLLSRAAKIAGAPTDMGAGIYLKKHKHDHIASNEIIFTLYSHNKDKLKYAIEFIKENPFINY